jgi:hypothetical protein
MAGDSACPACGIYFMKWTPPPKRDEYDDEELVIEEHHGFIGGLLQPKDKLDVASFYGRIAVLIGLAVWSWFLIRYDYRYGEINGSFMHNILLPIHEAGHVIFRILGRFMMILGGSLFQILLPFGICIAFIVMRRDNFGAAIGFWWASVSLVDVSPYIYDALHPQITLIDGSTGDESGIHDWINILTALHKLDHAQTYGTLAHFFGGVCMFLALVWAAIILLRQRSRLGDTAE